MKFDTLGFIESAVRIPSVSAKSEHAADVRKCAEFYNAQFLKLGFESEIVPTKMHPIVFARRKARVRAKFGILCYGHYDVQPAEPLEKWHSEPFIARVEGGSVFGRGVADNKGPFACMLAGVADFLEKNPDAPIDFGIVVEGEEEVGSPSMPEFIARRAAELSKYDFVMLSDTSSFAERVVVTAGLRGTGSVDAIFRGANTDVHSGMFGGVIYNPLQAMAEVCASLHSPDGLVNIPHFYDGIGEIRDWEKREIQQSPFGEAQIKRLLGIDSLYRQGDVPPALAGRVLPALEFVGMGGGYQGEGSKSVIPAECFCKISIRTVPPQKTADMLELVKNAIRERTPKQIRVEFVEYGAGGDGYFIDRHGDFKGQKGEKLAKVFDAVEACAKRAFGDRPLFLREGASIPLMADIKSLTGLDCIMLGLFTPENNIHAPDENFSIQTIKKAAAYYADFLETLC